MGHDPSDPPSGASGTRLERARLRHARSREALQAGDLKAAARHATEGVRLLTGAAEPPPEGAGAELSGAELAGVPTAGPEAAEAALLLANLAFCESALARNEAALSVIREAHRIADGCPDPEVLARVARIEGDIFGNAGRYLLARSRHEVARTLFHTLGNPLEEAMVLHNMGNDSAEQGRVSEAIGCFRDALPLFQEARAPRKEAMTLGCLAYARFQAGEWAESEAAFERLSASAGTFGDRRFESMVRRWRGELRLEQGRLEEARDLLAQAEAEATELDLFALRSNCRRLLADDARRQGRKDEACEVARAAVEEAIARESWDETFACALQATEIEATTGGVAAAQRYLSQALEATAFLELPQAAVWVELARGQIEEASGRPERALAHFRFVLDAQRKSEVALDRARANLDIGRVSLLLGLRPAALRSLRAARTVYARLGAAWHLDRVGALLAETGTSTGPPDGASR